MRQCGDEVVVPRGAEGASSTAFASAASAGAFASGIIGTLILGP